MACCIHIQLQCFPYDVTSLTSYEHRILIAFNRINMDPNESECYYLKKKKQRNTEKRFKELLYYAICNLQNWSIRQPLPLTIRETKWKWEFRFYVCINDHSIGLATNLISTSVPSLNLQLIQTAINYLWARLMIAIWSVIGD